MQRPETTMSDVGSLERISAAHLSLQLDPDRPTAERHYSSCNLRFHKSDDLTRLHCNKLFSSAMNKQEYLIPCDYTPAWRMHIRILYPMHNSLFTFIQLTTAMRFR